GLRSHCRPGGPPRHRRLDPAPDGTGGRDGRGAKRPRGGDRGGAAPPEGHAVTRPRKPLAEPAPQPGADAREPESPEPDAASELAAGGRIRVFLVDDHRLFLSGVRAELGEQFEIAGEATDVASAVSAIIAARPDVVLVDV